MVLRGWMMWWEKKLLPAVQPALTKMLTDRSTPRPSGVVCIWAAQAGAVPRLWLAKPNAAFATRAYMHLHAAPRVGHPPLLIASSPSTPRLQLIFLRSQSSTALDSMEIAGVALGVAPILVEVIKSWRMICVKINVFRHYSREVKRVFRKVSVQRAIFDTELETLLVNSGIPRSEAQSMLADNSHPRWMDPCGGLVHCLGKDTETFQELIESIAQALQEMQGELKAFDSVVQQMTQVSEWLRFLPRQPSHAPCRPRLLKTLSFVCV